MAAGAGRAESGSGREGLAKVMGRRTAPLVSPTSQQGGAMKIDLDAVEKHARHVSAQRKRDISWKVNVGPSGLVTLIFEDDNGRALDTASAETFAVLPKPVEPREQLSLLG